MLSPGAAAGPAVAGSGLAAIAAARRQASNPEGAGKRALKPSAASSWSTAEVADWLAVLGLEQYSPLLTQHALAGQQVLELSASDLDYMGITALGHRKLLLKGVDQLRVACGMQPASAAAPRAAALPSNPPAQSAAGTQAAPGKPVVHWSATVPKAGAAGASTSGTSSLLDGEFDEAGQAAAFQAAVAQWRVQNGKPSVSAPAGAAAGSGLARLGGSTWSNPFTSSGGADENANPEGGRGAGGCLLQGSYDEEAERRSFQEALAAWRKGDSVEGSKASMSTAEAGSSSPSRPAGGARAVCYQCYRAFYAAAGYTPQESQLQAGLQGKPFCSAACHAAAASAGEALSSRLSAGVAQKMQAQHDERKWSEEHEGVGGVGQAATSTAAQLDPSFDNDAYAAPAVVTFDMDEMTAAAEAAAIEAILARVAALEHAVADEPRPTEQGAQMVDFDAVDVEDFY